MVEFAKGLCLTVTDRDAFKQYIDQNANDPGVYYDSWDNNSVPTEMYINWYESDERDSYYRVLNKHTNGNVTTLYIDEEIVNGLLDAGTLSKDGYDVAFVDSNK